MNGTYSDAQRALYGFMIACHKALLAGTGPGRTDDAIHPRGGAYDGRDLDRTPFANPVRERAARSAPSASRNPDPSESRFIQTRVANQRH